MNKLVKSKTKSINPHLGSSFDDFLKEQNTFEMTQAKALKRVIAEQIEDNMQAANISKIDMAKRMTTSRSQLDRILNPDHLSIQLDTLIKAAAAVGKQIDIRFKNIPKRQSL